MTTTNDSEGGMAKTEEEMHDYWKCDLEGLGCANDPDHCGECGAPPNHPNHTCYQPSEIAAARTDAEEGCTCKPLKNGQPLEVDDACDWCLGARPASSAASESSHDFEDEDADWRKQPVALDTVPCADPRCGHPKALHDVLAGECGCPSDTLTFDYGGDMGRQPLPCPCKGFMLSAQPTPAPAEANFLQTVSGSQRTYCRCTCHSKPGAGPNLMCGECCDQDCEQRDGKWSYPTIVASGFDVFAAPPSAAGGTVETVEGLMVDIITFNESPETVRAQLQQALKLLRTAQAELRTANARIAAAVEMRDTLVWIRGHDGSYHDLTLSGRTKINTAIANYDKALPAPVTEEAN